MLFSSTKEKRGVNKARSRKGAVAFMAVLVVVVMAILFQAYSTHVLSDMKTGQTFDTQSQYNGERMAIGNLVKEAVLQYYERPRVGQDVPTTLQGLIDDYLAQMAASGTMTCNVTSVDDFPSNTPTDFWPTIHVPAAVGMSTAMGTFNLVSEKVPVDMSKSRMAQYAGDSDASILSVQKADGSDVFVVKVTRTDANLAIANFVYYLRLYQVPVTNFNLIAYAITDKPEDIPDAPPTLGAKIDPTALSSLALSKMGISGATNSIGQTVSYPYQYRELFSAAASVWEYALYNNSSNFNYMVTEVMKDANDIYMLSDPYTGDVNKQTGTGTSASLTSCSSPDGSTGFDAEYKHLGVTVDSNGYRVTSDGGVIDTTTLAETGLLFTDGTPVTTDLNGDGVINHQDVIVKDGKNYGLPDEVVWTFDLDKIAPINAVDNYRKIYVHLPDSIPTTIKTSTITIKDSTPGTAAASAKPVVFCIEGWSRVNKRIASAAATIPDNYKVYLDGDLTDQQVMLYVVGADVLLSSACSMDGVMMFDDYLSGFSRNTRAFAFRGLIAWNGKSASIGLGDDFITVVPIPPATDNQFRAIVPRFLLVDVRSETK